MDRCGAFRCSDESCPVGRTQDVHSFRARPTVKVLAALNDGWGNVRQRCQVEAEQWSELHPFDELDHPIRAESREQFGEDPAHD